MSFYGNEVVSSPQILNSILYLVFVGMKHHFYRDELSIWENSYMKYLQHSVLKFFC